MFQLNPYQSKLNELCNSHYVNELYLFGSALKNSFNEKSDIDILIQFGVIDVNEYFDNYIHLKEELELLFNRPVDLVENQAVRNPIFRKVLDREKQLIFERK